MNETCARSFGCEAAPGSASCATGGRPRDDELILHTNEEKGNDWDFAHVPVDPHVNVCARLCRDFDAIRELCCSINVSIPENTSGVASWALLNLKALLSAILPWTTRSIP